MEYLLEEGYASQTDQIQTLFLKEGGFSIKVFEHSLKNRPGILNCYAFDDGKLVGAKIGFSPRPQYFESWVGCVATEYHRQGIATQLLQLQHQWCTEKEFRYIETTTASDNIPMQLVNLKGGMKIIGTFLDRGDELKIKFQKPLTASN